MTRKTLERWKELDHKVPDLTRTFINNLWISLHNSSQYVVLTEMASIKVLKVKPFFFVNACFNYTKQLAKRKSRASAEVWVPSSSSPLLLFLSCSSARVSELCAAWSFLVAVAVYVSVVTF